MKLINKKMPIELFPDSPSGAMSPRISFSHDLPQNDDVPIQHYIRSSSTDFDFCVLRDNFDRDQSSSADELFSGGKILPVEIPKRSAPPPPPPPRPPSPPPQIQKNTESKALISEAEEKQNSNKSPFWRFKRSASFNCGNGYGRSLCPLPLLSRSNSTGSVKRSSAVSNSQKQSLLKYSSPNGSLKQPPPSISHQKPPLKKSGYGYYSNGVKIINPVLNVPPANLFGLGFIFSGGKERSKKK